MNRNSDLPIDEDYSKARDFFLRQQEGQSCPNLLTISTFFMFLLSAMGSFSILRIIILFLVLITHEMGHYYSMKIFDYRNVHLIFIPFFGAAVTGTKPENLKPWKEIVVFMAGPSPGIFLSAILFAYLTRHPDPTIFAVASLLGTINVLNLAPIAPLDGGHIFRILVFSRFQRIELLFLLGSACFFVTLAFIDRSVLWALVGFLGLITTRNVYKVIVSAANIQQKWQNRTPLSKSDLSEEQIRDLYDESKTAGHKAKQQTQSKLHGNFMKSTYAKLIEQKPSTSVILAFLILYFLFAIIGLGGLGYINYKMQKDSDFRKIIETKSDDWLHN